MKPKAIMYPNKKGGTDDEICAYKSARSSAGLRYAELHKKENAKTVDLLMSNIVTRTVVYALCSKFARTELMSGVTTIRTVGGLRSIDSRIRDDIDRGRVIKTPG